MPQKKIAHSNNDTICTCSWPDQKSEVPKHITPYVNFCDEIVIVDCILLKGTRIIIPETIRKEVLRQLHIGHLSMEKCQLLAHGSVYWSLINKDIKMIVEQYTPCQIMQKSQHKENHFNHMTCLLLYGTLLDLVFPSFRINPIYVS